MLENFGELFSRPGAERDLSALLDKAARARERVKDGERSKLRRQRERLKDELAIGRESLTCAVKEAEAGVLRAKEGLLAAIRAKCKAEAELRDFEHPVERRLNRIEGELARRAIGSIAPLRAKITEAKRSLGASPRWGMEKTSDDTYYRRADRLGEIERELVKLEERDSTYVEAVAPAIANSIKRAVR